jgi:hypothetical protein
MNTTPDQMNCTIKRKAGTYNCYSLQFKGLTRGSLLAMRNALATHAQTSSIAHDLHSFLSYAVENANDTELTETYKS